MVAIFFMATGCEKESPSAANSKPPAPIAKTNQDSSDSPNAETPRPATSPTQEHSAPKKKYTETIPETLVEFEMILLPGDDSNGIKPFYLGQNEVTWDEFDYWALCSDIKEKKAILEREKKLRPSPPHNLEAIYRNWGREGQPVVGVSRLSAERYCDWLTEQTGKKYRLPTAAEWDYAFEAGGGVLDKLIETDELEQIAWFEGNTLDMEKTFTNRAMGVGMLTPNQSGIHDMLGNVAEWVTDTGDENVARGGHFLTPASELMGNHREVEDQAVWNKNYPQGNKSIWWYVDADYVGFRLVCEPE